MTREKYQEIVAQALIGFLNKQVGAFLVAFNEEKISPELLLSCAEGMISFAVPCNVEGELIDIVGTGGDGLDTFNVSTAAALYVLVI